MYKAILVKKDGSILDRFTVFGKPLDHIYSSVNKAINFELTPDLLINQGGFHSTSESKIVTERKFILLNDTNDNGELVYYEEI